MTPEIQAQINEKGFKPRARIYSAYTPKRVDKNQPNIVDCLRKMGFMVEHLHEAGRGIFDLLISKGGLNILCEVKNGEKSPSARKLTGPQRRFHFSWQGMRCVLTCEEDCISLNQQINAILHAVAAMGFKLEVVGSLEPQYQPGLTP